jgi:hypothetical protein
VAIGAERFVRAGQVEHAAAYAVIRLPFLIATR